MNQMPPSHNTYLVHYGVKGMKWGVRRSPDQLGHTRQAKRTPKTIADISKVCQSSNELYGTKRGNAAATLGLKALKKVRGERYIDDWDHPSTKAWFLLEDQTLGMGTVADLVNHGYTAKQCHAMIDTVSKNWNSSVSERDRSRLFDLTEANTDELKKFASACEQAR